MWNRNTFKKMTNTAVIMAAGKGTRFGSRTSNMPKGFIPFNGVPMIEHSIDKLIKSGITKIIIGTGYHKEWYEKLANKYPQIQTVFSPRFASTNSMETLYVCRHAIGEEDFLLLESDIVYAQEALTSILTDKHPDIMLASEVTKFQDQYYIGVDDSCILEGCATSKDELFEKCGCEPYGELVGIHKISNRYFQEMVKDYEFYHEQYLKRGYEFELEDIATAQYPAAEFADEYGIIPSITQHYPNPIPLYVLKLSKLRWYEIDDEQDLAYAEAHVIID